MEQQIRKFIRRAQARSGNHTVDRKTRAIVDLPKNRITINFSAQVKIDTDNWKFKVNGKEVSASMYTRKEWQSIPNELKQTMI